MRRTADPNIQQGLKFVGYEACVAAGLDLERWVTGSYPRWLRVDVIAWYRLHNLVGLHTHDAADRAARMNARTKA